MKLWTQASLHQVAVPVYHHHRCRDRRPRPAQQRRVLPPPLHAVVARRLPVPAPGLDQRALYLGSAKPYAGREIRFRSIRRRSCTQLSLHPPHPPTHHCQPRHVRFREEMTRAAVSRSIGCYSIFLPFPFPHCSCTSHAPSTDRTPCTLRASA